MRCARRARSTGEQSNTSIIYEATGDRTSVICKVFRQLHHGENPDVTLQTALADGGSRACPAQHRLTSRRVGRRRALDRARASGHLAFAQEFLPGVQDAWRVALDAAAAGEDFTEPGPRPRRRHGRRAQLALAPVPHATGEPRRHGGRHR